MNAYTPTSEADRLRAIKPGVPHHSVFGNDNHAAIDAQICVLQERMDLDAIHREYGSDDYVLACALSARDWMDGALADDELPPAESWEGLV